MERVSFLTDDGVTIVGAHYPGVPGKPAALLLHMMPATKESWGPLADALSSMDWTVLAIDLRGHGESTRTSTGELHHGEFTNAQHQAKLKDIEAAVAWLEKRGMEKTRLALIGASIGANLAIAYAAGHEEVPAVVALSPGLEYRGVTTADALAIMSRKQHLLLAASDEDEYSFTTNAELRLIKKDADVRELKGMGHGTAMLDRYPPLISDICAWLTKIIR